MKLFESRIDILNTLKRITALSNIMMILILSILFVNISYSENLNPSKLNPDLYKQCLSKKEYNFIKIYYKQYASPDYRKYFLTESDIDLKSNSSIKKLNAFCGKIRYVPKGIPLFLICQELQAGVNYDKYVLEKQLRHINRVIETKLEENLNKSFDDCHDYRDIDGITKEWLPSKFGQEKYLQIINTLFYEKYTQLCEDRKFGIEFTKSYISHRCCMMNNFKNKKLMSALLFKIRLKCGKNIQVYPPYLNKTIHGGKKIWEEVASVILNQSPPPGTVIKKGSKISLTLKPILNNIRLIVDNKKIHIGENIRYKAFANFIPIGYDNYDTRDIKFDITNKVDIYINLDSKNYKLNTHNGYAVIPNYLWKKLSDSGDFFLIAKYTEYGYNKISSEKLTIIPPTLSLGVEGSAELSPNNAQKKLLLKLDNFQINPNKAKFLVQSKNYCAKVKDGVLYYGNCLKGCDYLRIKVEAEYQGLKSNQLTLELGKNWAVVPKLTGLVVDKVKKLVYDNGLKLDIKYAKTFYNNVVEKGVLSQNPDSCSIVPKGTSISVLVNPSKDKIFAKVPDVKGNRLNEAERMLKRAGLTINAKVAKTRNPKYADDEAIEQSPKAGSLARKGSVVTVYFNPSAKTVPSFICMPRYDAEKRAKSIGLIPKSIILSQIDTHCPEGTVVRTNLKSGSHYHNGDYIKLYINPYHIPNLKILIHPQIKKIELGKCIELRPLIDGSDDNNGKYGVEWYVDGEYLGSQWRQDYCPKQLGTHKIELKIYNNDDPERSWLNRVVTTVNVKKKFERKLKGSIVVFPNPPKMNQPVHLSLKLNKPVDKIEWYIAGSYAGEGKSVSKTFQWEGDVEVVAKVYYGENFPTHTFRTKLSLRYRMHPEAKWRQLYSAKWVGRNKVGIYYSEWESYKVSSNIWKSRWSKPTKEDTLYDIRSFAMCTSQQENLYNSGFIIYTKNYRNGSPLYFIVYEPHHDKWSPDKTRRTYSGQISGSQNVIPDSISIECHLRAAYVHWRESEKFYDRICSAVISKYKGDGIYDIKCQKIRKRKKESKNSGEHSNNGIKINLDFNPVCKIQPFDNAAYHVGNARLFEASAKYIGPASSMHWESSSGSIIRENGPRAYIKFDNPGDVTIRFFLKDANGKSTNCQYKIHVFKKKNRENNKQMGEGGAINCDIQSEKQKIVTGKYVKFRLLKADFLPNNAHIRWKVLNGKVRGNKNQPTIQIKWSKPGSETVEILITKEGKTLCRNSVDVYVFKSTKNSAYNGNSISGEKKGNTSNNNKTKMKTGYTGHTGNKGNTFTSNKIKVKKVYLGCFKDKGDPYGTRGRDLSAAGYLNDNSMSIERCLSICGQKGYRYAGVQYGNQCFCDNRYGKYGRTDNCNMKCSGNNKEICGGFWANSIYKVTKIGNTAGARHKTKSGNFIEQSARYLGCFKDQGDPFGLRGRDLAAFGFGSDRMTPNICMRECARRGYRYAGVQYSGYCFCGNRYGKYGRAANCNMHCSGDKSKICGGSWANGIYDVARLNIQKVNYGSGVEVNTDRPGLDYKSFNLPYPDYRLCQNACKKDPKCRAWTYVKPYTIQGPQARCWLKGSIPNQVRKSCCISGIKRISSNNTKTFRYPTINGYRLDWCRLWAQDCGQGAADAFCRKMRFTRAIAFEEDYDIGAKSPTYVIGSGKICNQSFCDGFKYITCTGRRFVIPPKKHKQIYTQPNVNKKLNCKDAYRRFVRAYNKLTNLISKGKGNTPEARRAKIEYDSARNAYANCRNANNNQSVSYSIDKCAAYQNKQDYISFRFPEYLNSKKHYINLTCSVYMLPKGSKIKVEWFYVMPNKDYPIGAKTIFVNKTSKKDKYVNFRIESDRDWPAGIYRVRITLNGKEMDVVSFKVR